MDENTDTFEPEVVDETIEEEEPEQAITEPAKLMRIASVARAMLIEAREAEADEAGRLRLKEIYERTIAELATVLSEDLKEELGEMMVSLDGEAPTQSELRIAQAQLVGWLEGLFNGIQAAVMTQQLAAQSQLAQMQRRALEGQATAQPGQYL